MADPTGPVPEIPASDRNLDEVGGDSDPNFVAYGELENPRANKIARFVGWYLSGLVVGAIVSREYYRLSGTYLLLAAVPWAIIGMRFHFQRWTGASLHSRMITLYGENELCLMGYHEPILIWGKAGISLDGGEMLVWKRLVVKTEDRTFTLRMSPAANAACFDALVAKCPNALGIPVKGEIRLPSALIEWDDQKQKEVIAVLKKTLLGQSIRTASVSVLCFMLSAVASYGMLTQKMPVTEQSSKIIIGIIVCAAVGIVFALFALKSIRLMTLVRRCLTRNT